MMRVAMLYALLDGSSLIEEAHLRAALALWEYADASAHRIFAKEESINNKHNTTTEEPLPLRLLKAIEASPGLSKSEMHGALGRNRKAEDIATALEWLLGQGLAHPETCSTGGRPSECWFPGKADEQTNKVESASSSAESITKERTNEESAGGDSSFVAIETTNEESEQPESAEEVLSSFVPLSLTELCQQVNALPGKLVWRGGCVVVEAEAVPAHIARSCEQLQKELAGIIPKQEVEDSEAEEPWRAVLSAIRAKGGDVKLNEEGECELRLLKPDPALEQAYAEHSQFIGQEIHEEKKFLTDLWEGLSSLSKA